MRCGFGMFGLWRRSEPVRSEQGQEERVQGSGFRIGVLTAGCSPMDSAHGQLIHTRAGRMAGGEASPVHAPLCPLAAAVRGGGRAVGAELLGRLGRSPNPHALCKPCKHASGVWRDLVRQGVGLPARRRVTHIPRGSRRHSHYGEEISAVPAARFNWTREEVRRGEWPGLPAYPLEDGGVRGWLGFVLLNRFGGATYGDIYWSQQAVVVPYWFLAASCLLCLLPTAHAVARHVRAKIRSGAGRCPSCGYDLRATPGRCPECGAVPTARPSHT